jgi:hypothetical protein
MEVQERKKDEIFKHEVTKWKKEENSRKEKPLANKYVSSD